MLCSALLEILTKKYQIYMDIILAEINNLLCTVFQPITGYIFNISVLKHHSQIYGIYEKKNLVTSILLISYLYFFTDLVFEHFQLQKFGEL